MKNNNFEKLNNGVWKKIVIGSTCLIAILSVGILATSKAKYRLTQDINIVNGTINYKVPDLKVMAMYTSEDGTNYTETTTMPETGYAINEEKTYCTTDNVNQVKGKIKTENGKVTLQSLTKGDKCYLYFDKKATETINTALGTIEVKLTTPDFSKRAMTDEGVFKIKDGMYGDYSYYWRGAATTNHIIFANLCWRIIRINGDGSIRLIYNGTPNDTSPNQTCPGNGENEGSVITGSTNAEKYYATNNGKTNNSAYVGWTYTIDSQRPTNNATGTESNAKVQTEKWYKANITDKGFDGKVATGLFCNDRNVGEAPSSWSDSEYISTWSATGTQFAYTGPKRLYETYAPTLDCSNAYERNDVYNLKVGAITADEVELAGGKNELNKSFYLYNGQSYWTMSPYSWRGTSAWMFVVTKIGFLNANGTNSTFGLRPVINLRSDITISSGDGTQSTPYIVQ